MRKHTMPQARQMELPKGIEWDVSPQAFENWNPGIVPAAAQSEATITLLGRIGVDPDTGEGITDSRVAGALRSIGADKDVVIYLNSPGGNLVQGTSIYSLLREHKGKVTIKVLSMAASAASIIAMAADELQIARAAFLMVHNSWAAVLGNRNDLRDVADYLEPFDMGMAEIYAARTGIDIEGIQKRMDAETMINGTVAVSEGWADALLPADQLKETKAGMRGELPTAYRLDAVLAKAGMPRSERRSILQDLKASTLRAAGLTGTPRAADNDTPRAVVAPELMDAFKSFSMPA